MSDLRMDFLFKENTKKKEPQLVALGKRKKGSGSDSEEKFKKIKERKLSR